MMNMTLHTRRLERQLLEQHSLRQKGHLCLALKR